MKIYRKNGLVVIEKINVYAIDQLECSIVGNNIKLNQHGMNSYEIITHYANVKDHNNNSVGNNTSQVLDYVKSIIEKQPTDDIAYPNNISISMMTNTHSEVISLVGNELNESRRYVDLTIFTKARVQFKSTSIIDVRVDYSLNNGSTWLTLVPFSTYNSSNPYVTSWIDIPIGAKTDNTLIRAFSKGLGLLASVNFVELNLK